MCERGRDSTKEMEVKEMRENGNFVKQKGLAV